jgi:hypothetical protein
MCVSPDFEIEGRKRHGFVVSYAEDADVGQLAKPAADKDRLGQRRVMVPRKDHDREISFGEQPPSAIEDGRAELIILEGVASQQQDVGAQRPGGRQHRAQRDRAIAAMGDAAIFVDMQIRAVNKYDIRGHRRAIAPSATHAQSEQYGTLPRCLCCFCRKFIAGEVATAAQILGFRRGGKRKNSENRTALTTAHI